MTTVGYGDKKVESFGGKVIALIWMFTALLFISGLTASIASTIMSERGAKRIEHISDLTDSKVGTMAGTSMEVYLRKRFFKKMVAFPDIQSGLRSVKEGHLKAFIYDEPILKYRLAEFQSKDLEVLHFSFDQQLYAFGLSKQHTTLENRISERILYYTQMLEWKILLSEYDLDTE